MHAYLFRADHLRFVEYRVGSDDYIRMKYTVQGSRSQGVVQLESKKVKVGG